MRLFGGQDRDGVELDLTGSHRRAQESERARGSFGLPMPCPDCGGPGYLDHIDMVRRAQLQHCPSCGRKWEVTEAELGASS